MQHGAADYLLKPFDAGELEVRIARALAQRRSQIENEYWRDEAAGASRLEELIGVSPALRERARSGAAGRRRAPPRC